MQRFALTLVALASLLALTLTAIFGRGSSASATETTPTASASSTPHTDTTPGTTGTPGGTTSTPGTTRTPGGTTSTPGTTRTPGTTTTPPTSTRTSTPTTPTRTPTPVTPTSTPTSPSLASCTPGFWKNEKHFQYWTGYTPGQTVDSVFAGVDPSLADESLLDALQGGGGDGLAGAEEILLRAAVAGLLNAANGDLNYGKSTADVIDAVNDAIATGDRDTILDLATALDDANNAGDANCF